MKALNFWAIAAFSLLITVGSMAQAPTGQRSRTDPVKVGEIAPDFDLTDQNGKSVRLATIKKPVVLVFYRGYW